MSSSSLAWSGPAWLDSRVPFSCHHHFDITAPSLQPESPFAPPVKPLRRILHRSARSLPRRVGGEPVILSPSHPASVASEVLVSQPPESLFHDTDETHDHDDERDRDHDPTAPYHEQRQQHSAWPLPLTQLSVHPDGVPDQDHLERLSTPGSSVQRSLRRTPNFEGAAIRIPEPRQVHIAAASIGILSSPAASTPFARARLDSSITRPSSGLFQDRARVSSDKDSENLAGEVEKETFVSDCGSSSQYHHILYSSSNRTRREPYRVVRVSRNTHSAVLFALEEALRRPYPYTPDVVEESSDMADLMAATSGIPATTNGHGTTGSRRPTAGPAPTSSPSGIRGPRIIMQERAAREARQKAEAELIALERSRAEHEARSLEETRRRNAERRPAGAAPGLSSSLEPEQQQHLRPDPRIRSQVAQETVDTPRNTIVGSTAKASMHRHHHDQPSSPPQQHQQMPQQFASSTIQQIPTSPTFVPSSGRPRAQQQQQQQEFGSNAPPLESTTRPTESSKPRNSFPHAFERWETLSAHWEGLTSYWIRKLEQNKDEINHDPLSQQLARQVTDLSAAGANLFHAVVELQRLRASSERKFQRWFFETRTELERAQEVTGMLEKALERERRDRADAIRDAVEHERGSSKAQKQLAEMRKELSISKEEARRAWEELGRREQEERDRTFSLQSGQPTIVGGVQVVPMTPMAHGGVGRQGTTRDPAAYQQEYAPEGYGGSERSQATPATASPPPPLPTTAGPSGAYYQSESQEPGQQSQSQPQPQPARAEAPDTEGAPSRGEYVTDAAGNFVLDFRGQKIPFVAAPPSGPSVSDLETEDYNDTPAKTTIPPSGGHEPMAASTSADDSKWTGTYSDPQDYSGQGYGAPGWETVPRHHHPTRLSDVIEEEDERSRTSATQSRAG
ncbi:hypothetical protein E4U55_007967 [Claviceps digitariae]|nr:hypothetical protein E4U55_007967 [Claviceps digitariae]